MGYLGYVKEEKYDHLAQQLTEAKAEIERLASHNAMLVEAAELGCVSACTCLTKTPEYMYHDSTCRYRILQEAITATTESIQQWLAKHDAEVRRNTLIDAASEFGVCDEDVKRILRRMADENWKVK